MTCSSCHKSVSENSKFCIHCGHKVEQIEEGSVDKYFSQRNKDLVSEAKSSANQEMTQGIVIFVIGLIITGGTYLAAEPGGTYTVAWGAMVFGVIALLRGYYYRLRPQDLVNKQSSRKEETSKSIQEYRELFKKWFWITFAVQVVSFALFSLTTDGDALSSFSIFVFIMSVFVMLGVILHFTEKITKKGWLALLFTVILGWPVISLLPYFIVINQSKKTKER